VKIRFPDGIQVQGTFGADETIGDIYQFVREQLAQDEAFQLRMSF
jgi:UBX domain